MNKAETDYLMRGMLVEGHGTAQQQKDDLVADILAVFQSPDLWPMTDDQRIKLLRRWYTMAKTIQQTQGRPTP